jgi:hypothetical protein
MICSKCGLELKDNIKYCTKCGTKLIMLKNNKLSFISIVLSSIGIIGIWILNIMILKLLKTGINTSISTLYTIQYCFSILLYCGLLISIIAQYKQKSKINFIIGISICVYFVIITIFLLFYSKVLLK